MTTRADRSRGMPRRTTVETAPRTNRTPLLLVGGGILLLVVVAAVAALLLSGGGGGLREPATTPIAISGNPLPAYDPNTSDTALGQPIPTLTGTDLSAQPMTIGPDQGPMAIVVLAHWCHVCQAEVPQLVDWLSTNQVPEGVKIVTLTTSITPTAQNYPPSTWLDREGWTAPTMVDDGNSRGLDALGISAFPGFVFVDADGRVVQRVTGQLPAETFGQMLQAIAP
ncbi:MAG TPA: TlpA disulfide reductase family protein [Candidatus Limnocylindria bacterium]|nr:TlpA disulfide reductase family protein [Candidatus Limnocylindria bacterium]